MLLNTQWQFVKLPAGSAPEDVQTLPEAVWQDVDIPHDWLIAQEDALYEDGDGWYRRALPVPEDFEESCWQLNFDGVYMDCDVFVNGARLATHRYGYTPFTVALDGVLHPGDNDIRVCVRHRSPNSRWYSGAGIFRDVTLRVLPRRHLAPEGLTIATIPVEGGWRVAVTAEAEGEGENPPAAIRLMDASGAVLAEAALTAGDDPDALRGEVALSGGEVWGCEHPALYPIEIVFGSQTECRRVGLRTTAFDPEKGFILNGEPVKLKGVCLHHDLGALGAAFNAAAFRRQIREMKRMGVNALRTTHNPPAARALDICDEEGVLVIDEAFDMWEMAKTPYDYARFFPQCWREDVAAWIRRDRCHACVVMWSIGNEIQDTHVSDRGREVAVMLRDEVRRHDPAGRAAVTFGSNYMPWENTQRAADELKVVGYNYGEKYYAAHHAEHPDWVIYGSETGSILSSRGVYHFPAGANILSEEDLQCSALGNSATSWGTPDMRHCLVDDLNTPWSMGQFLWSGIDYIGEPTPYHTRSCYFGMMDTALFPKEFFYQVKALWNPEPMARVGVPWDWNPGQIIDVPVYTNGARCELFLNGQSLGTRQIDLRDAERSVGWWRVPYAPGRLEAVAYDGDGQVIARDARESFGDSARLVLLPDKTRLRCDGEDIAFVEVRAVDAQGRWVENAADRVTARVEGVIDLLGMDNGDSTDPDGYQVDCRRLFNGRLLLMIGASDCMGDARVMVSAPGLEGATLPLEILRAEPREGGGRMNKLPLHGAHPHGAVDARRIEIAPVEAWPEGVQLTPERPEAAFTARLLPADADAQPIAWRIVTALGIDSACAEVVPTADGAKVIGRGDGQVYLRATCSNGEGHPRVISQLEVTLTGFGCASLNPYEFIAAGLYDDHDGEVGAGNDHGVAFARDGESMAGYANLDFGPVGSDEITVPIFALDGNPYDLNLWMGDPRSGGHLVAKLRYQKPSIWNTYQSETWKLPERFTGMQSLWLGSDRKFHVKGFVFTRQSRAWLPLTAGEADALYGDSFRREGGAVRGIGNNVSLEFQHMDFGAGGAVRLTLTGATPLAVNSVQVRFTDASGEQRVEECPFRGDGGARQTFHLTAPAGECAVTFVFLPGSQFDFEGFVFEKAGE